MSKPADYLPSIARQPVPQLPDPTESDKTTPLLYRLGRLSADLLRVALPPPLNEGSLAAAVGAAGLDPRSRERLAGFVEALARLAARPGAQLETLMIEVPRSTALSRRRVDCGARAAPAQCASQGRKPRPADQLFRGSSGKICSTSATGGGDGYLQAPSVAHAVTVALLRSAARRFHDSAGFSAESVVEPRAARARHARGAARGTVAAPSARDARRTLPARRGGRHGDLRAARGFRVAARRRPARRFRAVRRPRAD